MRLFEEFFGKAHELIIFNLRWRKLDVTQGRFGQASVLAKRLKTAVLCLI